MTNILETFATLYAVAFIYFIFIYQGFSVGYLSCNRIECNYIEDIMS